jgi:excisionase family DNA binding protein
MTPEGRVLAAVDELHDALAALFAAPRESVEPPALVTLSEAARRLGVSRSTITRWADAGRLRVVGPPNARRVPKAELERLAA